MGEYHLRILGLVKPKNFCTVLVLFMKKLIRLKENIKPAAYG